MREPLIPVEVAVDNEDDGDAGRAPMTKDGFGSTGGRKDDSPTGFLKCFPEDLLEVPKDDSVFVVALAVSLLYPWPRFSSIPGSFIMDGRSGRTAGAM